MMTTDEQLKLLKDKAIEWKTILRQTYNGCSEVIAPLRVARDIELTFIKMEDTSLD